jgi:hypothetical protein
MGQSKSIIFLYWPLWKALHHVYVYNLSCYLKLELHPNYYLETIILLVDLQQHSGSH